MKKLYVLTVLAVAAILLTACGPSNELVVYMPKEYISEDVVLAFEEEYGIKVALRYFDSNEVALTQAKVNNYDLIIPSDYAIEELATEGYLKEIDWTRLDIETDDLSTKLTEVLAELESDGFDLLKYSMPYFWGTIGIIYDNTKAGLAAQLEAEGWNAFQDQALTKMIYDSPRDAFMAALYAQSTPISMSTATQADIDAAEQWLKDSWGDNTYLKSDEILEEAIGAVPYDIAMVYSGDAAYILQNTPEYSFFVPEWTNVWVDGFVIPKNTQHEDWAYDFINFMSSYDAVLDNTLEMRYSPIRQDVLDELLTYTEVDPEEEDPFYVDDRINLAFNFTVDQFNYEFYRYDNDLKDMIDEGYNDFQFSH